MSVVIVCPKCGEEIYEHMYGAHLDKDHVVQLEPAMVAELVWGYESHDEYYDLGRASVLTPDSWSFSEAEDEVRELAHLLIDDEWSGWYRIESITRVSL